MSSYSEKRFFTPSIFEYQPVGSKKVVSLIPKKRLGKGGFGFVYRSTDTRSNKEYALKFESIDPPNEPPYNIFAELRTMLTADKIKTLNNFAVISRRVVMPINIYQQNIHYLKGYSKYIGLSESTPMIVGKKDKQLKQSVVFVEPLVHGETLDKIIQNKLNMPYVKRLEIMLNLLTGLSIFHAEDLVLSDIKPGNIMIDDGKPKFIDFSGGCWRDFCNKGGAYTKHYRSPDLIKRDRTSSILQLKEGDVYSLGITFVELLTGRVPYGNTQQMTRVMRSFFQKNHYDTIRDDLNSRVIRLMRNYPEDIQSLVKSMVEPDFQHRVTALRAFHHLQDILRKRKKTTKTPTV